MVLEDSQIANTEEILAQELVNITTDVIKDKIEYEYKEAYDTLTSKIDQTFNNTKNDFEDELSDDLNVKIATVFSQDIKNYVDTLSFDKTLNAKSILLDTNKQITEEKVNEVITPHILSNDSKLTNIQNETISNKQKIQDLELTSVTNLNSKLETIEQTITTANTNISNKITDLLGSIESGTQNSSFENTMYIVNVFFGNTNDAINNLINNLNSQEDTIGLNHK
jgi:hypothetical protein